MSDTTIKSVKLPKTHIRLRDRVTKGKVKSFIGKLFIYILLIEVAFIIIFPILTKLSSAVMSPADTFDRTVHFIARHPTLANFQTVLTETNYLLTTFHTLIVALLAAVLQTLVCSVTGYGLAKVRGRLGSIAFGIVILSILIPPAAVLVPMYLQFRYMSWYGLVQVLLGQQGVLNTIIPLTILSITGFGFKNGLYIFIMRQFYKGVPEEIEEASAIDGYGVVGTYFRIVLPMAVPMMITIFMFAFCWAWTDTFYSGIFFSNFRVLANSIFTMPSAVVQGATSTYNATLLMHTGVLIAIAPLIVIYCVAQKWIIAGIERSGLVG